MAKTCQFKKCKNRTVNNLYQYCTWHMVHGEPLINLKEPDECPICLEPNTEDVPYIVLTTVSDSIDNQGLIIMI